MSGSRGLLTAEQVEDAIRPKDPYTIQTALICLENTHNAGGGSVYPIETISAIRRVADRQGLPMHLDGARLFNAVVASGVSAAEYARYFDTVTFCLSKGLGAPAGSLIATDDRALAERLRRFRRMYGGAMRQAGILAAAGIHALEHHITRLADDHANAKRFATLLAAIPTVSIDPSSVDTNIIFFDIKDNGQPIQDIVSTLKQEGVFISATGGRTCRAVTHLDVSSKDVEQAAAVLAGILR
ncbi:MAG: GntG family PLP-dependent aldolase [Nitrospiraceae bacterium]